MRDVTPRANTDTGHDDRRRAATRPPAPAAENPEPRQPSNGVTQDLN